VTFTQPEFLVETAWLPAEQFAEAMGRYGVGDGTRVILYDGTKDSWPHMWAARVWWMLKVFGFDNAAVLNGGIHKWRLERRPVSTAPPTYPPAVFAVRHRPALIATKDDVLAGIDDRATRLVNALPADVHAGASTTFARAGHIPSSVNVPTVDLVDPVTQAYLPPEQLRAKFAEAGALDGEKAITYCRAGIAASSDALILTLLGQSDVAVYDGSLAEWAADPTLPLVTAPEFQPAPPASGASEPRRT
jgi:thiosulfate/3-mercaptopyruvate sulfurtransferase